MNADINLGSPRQPLLSQQQCAPQTYQATQITIKPEIRLDQIRWEKVPLDILMYIGTFLEQREARMFIKATC
ncbi:MAG: hypothetical protein HY069_03475, partial [Chlamydiia bacterium]|nr:hypothetical protein [Chlamydiia bacterium]